MKTPNGEISMSIQPTEDHNDRCRLCSNQDTANYCTAKGKENQVISKDYCDDCWNRLGEAEDRALGTAKRQAKIGAAIVDKFLIDEEGDQENAVRDIIAALLHYCTTTPLTHSITGERWDPVEEARMGVWHWYSEHINPGGYAADDPEHTVEITIKHKHSELFEALSR